MIPAVSIVTIFLNNYRKFNRKDMKTRDQTQHAETESGPLRVFDERFGTRPLDAITVKDVVSVPERVQGQRT